LILAEPIYFYGEWLDWDGKVYVHDRAPLTTAESENGEVILPRLGPAKINVSTTKNTVLE
jgi:hypothetical protein